MLILPKSNITFAKETIKYESTPLIILSVCKLTFDGNSKTTKKLNDFYTEISNGFMKFAKTYFYTYALADYESDTNPRKKYRYTPFCLLLQIDCQSKTENSLHVNIIIQVIKNKKTIAKKHITNKWSFIKNNVFLTK